MSKGSCKGRFSSTMQLDHCQSALVLSKRVQDEADVDKKQRSFQGFQLALSPSLAVVGIGVGQPLGK